MASDTIELNTPIAEGGVRAINFFNGRLLTAGDLSREQDARRTADMRLGAALGTGVAWGLQVRRQAQQQRVLQVGAGLAVNAAGQALYLQGEQLLQLAPTGDTRVASTGGSFGPCGTLAGGAYVVGEGLWLLTLAPTRLNDGRAPVLALDAANARCATDVVVEAVQFRMLRVNLELLQSSLDGNVKTLRALHRLRSDIAAAMFDLAGNAAAHADPGRPATAGVMARLRQVGLSDCDVPLALVFVTASDGIRFVDRWAVRRRVALDAHGPDSGATDAAVGNWWPLLGPGADRLAEAQCLQFQEQLSDLVDDLLAAPANGKPADLQAADWLGWLPPVGIADATGARALLPAAWLAGNTLSTPLTLAPAALRDVLGTGLRREPLRTDQSTRLRLYTLGDGAHWCFVREAANQLMAEEVAFDPTLLTLAPKQSTVQTAIEELWRIRQAGWMTVVTPNTDLAALVVAVPAGSDLTLYFTAGRFHLPQPLVIQGLGAVVLQGTGAATQIDCAAERVLDIVGCGSLALRHLGLTATSANSEKSIRGALSVTDTPDVCVEGVYAGSARSVPAHPRAATLRVDNRALAARPGPPVTRVRITGCSLVVGRGQVGILCMDNDSTVLRDNRIEARPAPPGKVFGPVERAELAIEARLFVLLRKGTPYEKERFYALMVEQVRVANPTPPDAAQQRRIGQLLEMAIKRYQGVLLGGTYASPYDESLFKTVDVKVVGAESPMFSIIRGDSKLVAYKEALVPLKEIDRLVAVVLSKQEQAVTVLQRGIVVAGTRAAEVQITGNEVLDVVEGITVAVSRAESRAEQHAGKPPLRVEHVVVSDNHVHLNLPPEDASGNRFGIAIGNADGVRVTGNRVTRSALASVLLLDAVRLHGHFGPQVLVRDNVLTPSVNGIAFTALGLVGEDYTDAKRRLWVFEGNFTQGLAAPVLVQPPPLAAGSVVVLRDNR